MTQEVPEFWKKIFKTPSIKKQRIGKKTEINRYYRVLVMNSEDNDRGEVGIILDDFYTSTNNLEKTIQEYQGTELLFYCFLTKEFDKGNKVQYRPKVRHSRY